MRDARELAPDVPLACYQVSGEFAMIHAGANAGVYDLKAMALESAEGFLRAGASSSLSFLSRSLSPRSLLTRSTRSLSRPQAAPSSSPTSRPTSSTGSTSPQHERAAEPRRADLAHRPGRPRPRRRPFVVAAWATHTWRRTHLARRRMRRAHSSAWDERSPPLPPLLSSLIRSPAWPQSQFRKPSPRAPLQILSLLFLRSRCVPLAARSCRGRAERGSSGALEGEASKERGSCAVARSPWISACIVRGWPCRARQARSEAEAGSASRGRRGGGLRSCPPPLLLARARGRRVR